MIREIRVYKDPYFYSMIIKDKLDSKPKVKVM